MVPYKISRELTDNHGVGNLMRIDQFPPVPAAPMIIQSRVTSTGAVFPRPRSKRRRIRSDGLHSFSVGQSYSIHQHKVERDLTAHTVANQVKLGYRYTPAAEFLKIEGEWRCVCFKMLLKLRAPLTPNVIRNEDTFDSCFNVAGH